MADNKDKLTRRDFIRGAAGAVIAGAAAASLARGQDKQPKPDVPEPAAEVPKGRELPAENSRVVLVRHEKAMDEEGKIDADILAGMLDDGVTKLLGIDDVKKAWATLIKPDDVVGIKSNVWRFLPTPPELEETIKKRVMGAGVPEDKIGIDDRGVLGHPVFKQATALINVRPLRTHHWSGVGSLIKNYIMFHPQPAAWHDDACADLAGLWDLPAVRDKTRLNILVMLNPLFFSKGPHAFNPTYTWKYKGLLISKDPVAADAVGVRIFEAKRKQFFEMDVPFNTSPKHVKVAQEKFKLGYADENKIDLIKLGWEEGGLV